MIIMNIIKIRAIVSFFLIISFIVVFLTGYGLYLAPSGRIAREVAWSFAGLGRDRLESMHTLSSFIMSGLVAIHLLLNYKLFLSEIKSLFKK